MGPLPRRSMFALRATGAVAATAAHAASFGNPDERPQGAVNANGGIQKLHWHQVAEWTFMTYGRCPAVYGVLRMVQSVLTIGTPGVMLSFGPFAMIYFIVLGGAAMLFLLRLFARSPAAGEAGPPTVLKHAVGITPGPSPTGTGFQCQALPARSNPVRIITDRNHHERASSPCLIGR